MCVSKEHKKIAITHEPQKNYMENPMREKPHWELFYYIKISYNFLGSRSRNLTALNMELQDQGAQP